jgi:hypothetical protein
MTLAPFPLNEFPCNPLSLFSLPPISIGLQRFAARVSGLAFGLAVAVGYAGSAEVSSPSGRIRPIHSAHRV